MNPIYQNLKTYFGYDSFRPGQEKIITAILSGRDALGIMPTGAGKSLCYQIPALTFPGLTVVISPLISLMEDQVAALKRRGIGAELINSAVNYNRRKSILTKISTEYGRDSLSYSHHTSSSSSSAFHQCSDSSIFPESLPSARSESSPIKLLYVSPERLSAPEFRAFAQKIRISFLCVDEAHCISLWGRQFRPEYMKIAEFIEALPTRPVVAAFTATANAEVRSDIIDNLKLREPYVLTTGFDRPNLYFEVQKDKDKWLALSSLLTRHRGECGIIYCLTRRTVESLSRKLEVNGFTVAHYHGGMPLEEREKAQRDWLDGKRNVIVATNAFGMGIDKPDVRFVIHYNMPGSMENYYQEAGRAGRDGLPSDCFILYNYRDVVINRFFISYAGIMPGDMVKGGEHRSVSIIEGVYVAIDNDIDLDELRAHERRKLAAMQRFVAGDVCLRQFMLGYFGEHAPSYCGKCSRCLSLVPFGQHQTSLIPDVESPDLYSELRSLRLRLSRKYGILPHKIFPDKILHVFARARPRSVPAMLLIEGINFVSVFRYGREFVEEIRLFVETN
ncbi:MAG: ATP-dependent DNA helicase RecQ [Lachnospiraceae bacterium]|nr:ATP-dependent DNA helicase RecQ [Lachnospiraceae bacterium]